MGGGISEWPTEQMGVPEQGAGKPAYSVTVKKVRRKRIIAKTVRKLRVTIKKVRKNPRPRA